MTLNEYILTTSACGIEKYQLLSIDMTKDSYKGRYRSGLKSIVVPDSSLFYIE